MSRSQMKSLNKKKKYIDLFTFIIHSTLLTSAYFVLKFRNWSVSLFFDLILNLFENTLELILRYAHCSHSFDRTGIEM